MLVRAAGLLLLPVLLFSTPGSAAADLGKCEAKLLKAASKFGINVSKALQKCTAGARKAVDKNGAVDAKTADKCEKNLAKIFNIGGDPGKGFVNKTLKSIDKLFTPGREVCDSADLAALALPESGINAPGTNPQDFLASWLILRQTQLAITEVFGVAGDFQDVLDDMIALTDCAAAERPNLCTFSAEQNPDCVTQTCNMSSTARLLLNDNGLSATFQDHPLTMQVCQAPAGLLGDLPVDLSGSFRALSLGTATRLGPTTLTGANATVCMDQLRAVGWCDCNGAGVPFEVSTCQDHIANDQGGTCSETGDFCLVDEDCPGRGETCSSAGVDECGADLAGAAVEDACVRAGTADGDCFAAGGSCINGDTLGVCHPGTYIGAPALDITGASGAGDCSLVQTVSFRVVPPAVCANPSELAMGSCTTNCPGPGACAADAACLGLGGTQCLPSRGADGVACTRDDLVLPRDPVTITFTTGAATSAVRDRVLLQGTCSGGSVNAGMNCMTDEDCNGGTCGGEVAQPSGVDANDTGAPLTCGAYDGGDLGGLRLVGGFAWLNGAALGDQTAMVTLDCD